MKINTVCGMVVQQTEKDIFLCMMFRSKGPNYEEKIKEYEKECSQRKGLPCGTQNPNKN